MIAAVVTLEERPDLVEPMWAMPNHWPTFMRQDPVGALFYGRLADTFPHYQLVALDHQGAIVAKVHSVPFVWGGSDEELPARGWDGILERAFRDHASAQPATAVSLIEARIVPDRRREGLSYELLDAARRNARRLGFADLFGPVRPSEKSVEPRTPMSEYVARVRADGLPADFWLRVHVRLGGRIVGVCPLSMVIPGTLAQWRAWTGLALDSSGLTDIPGALSPLQVSIEHDHAVYVEPNVWVHHRLTPSPGDPTRAADNAAS